MSKHSQTEEVNPDPRLIIFAWSAASAFVASFIWMFIDKYFWNVFDITSVMPWLTAGKCL